MKAKMSKAILQAIQGIAQAVGARFVTIHCSVGGWEMRMVDASHVVMVSAIVTADRFAEYDMDEYTVCLPIEKLKAALSVMGKEVEMTITDDRITLKSESVKRSFAPEMPDESPKMPSFSKDNPATIDTSLLKKALAACDFADCLKLSLGPDGLLITAAGTTDDMTAEYPDCKCDELFTSSYSKQYLSDILKAMSGRVTMYIGNDYPLTVTADEPFDMEFILAPRVEDRCAIITGLSNSGNPRRGCWSASTLTRACPSSVMMAATGMLS